jgi:hypothetical protein
VRRHRTEKANNTDSVDKAVIFFDDDDKLLKINVKPMIKWENVVIFLKSL